MKLIRLFTVHLFLIGFFLSIAKINLAQTQKNATNLQIDTVYLRSVESSHFKIKIPKVEDLAVYEDLFNTYGKLSIVKIKSRPRRFLGDFKNISRAKYVNGTLNKAGITNTKITLFEVWVPPIIPKKEKEVSPQKKNEVVSQTAIISEQSIKSKKKQQNTSKTDALNPASPNFNKKKNKTNPFPSRPKNSAANNEAQIDKSNVKKGVTNQTSKTKTPAKKVETEKPVNTKATAEKIATNKPANTKAPVKKVETEKSVNTKATAEKTATNKPTNTKIPTEKVKTNKTANVKAPIKKAEINNATGKESNSDQFILILPKVTNPVIYQYVLKDLGTVDAKKLPNEQWYYYVGFFKDVETAKTIIPKIKERGFTTTAKVSSIKNAEKTALTMYKDLPPAFTKKPAKSKKIDKSLYYKIELPPVSNPEIYFKAFEDIGLGFSEITPNGKAIYYMGEFQTADMARTKVAELKERGLSNGTIVKFKNDTRLDAYSEIYTKKAGKEPTENIDEVEVKKEVMIKTHADGSFQIRLKQVENPDVLKSVFEDVGKLKVGYLKDDTEYYFIGNYLFQKDAEKVIAQLKERGLTKLDLLNIMAADDTPEVLKEKISGYKIKLGALKDEHLNLFESYGTISSIKKEKTTDFYLGNYPTQKVANLILQELKRLELEISYEIKFFAE